jgi:hypothetical protein
MITSTAELHSVARAVQAATVPAMPTALCVDLHDGIHKAVRALMADTLVALGRMDPDDGLELAYTGLRVMHLLDFCRDHLQQQHGIDALATTTERLLACPDAERGAQALALHRALSVFIAHHMEPLQLDDTLLDTMLWARFSDVELRDIEAGLRDVILPHKTMFVLRWLVPFMGPAERAAVLGALRARTPALAFYAALDVVRQHLTAREWCKLSQTLELRAAA